jgi:hypothetical protein
VAVSIKEADILAKCNECGLFHGDKELLPLFKSAWTLGYPKNVPKLLEILKHVLANQYSHVNMPRARFEIVNAADSGAYADVTLDPQSKAWPVPFRFASDTFDRPAGLIVTLGHELIHQFQIKAVLAGKYKSVQNWTGVNSVAKAFWELEAHTWELGSDLATASPHAWPFGENRFLPCLTSQERDIAKKDREAAVEAVDEALSILSVRDVYLSSIEAFIHSDPWAKAVWLPGNPDWRDRAREGK